MIRGFSSKKSPKKCGIIINRIDILQYTVLCLVLLNSYKGTLAKEFNGNWQQQKEVVQEFYRRGGMPNLISKALSGKAITIGYIGGSITHSPERYQEQTTNYIKNIFPKSEVTAIVAGVPGTDADLGACRINDQLLVHNPDLIFVEFAVNGGFDAGVEGIVRQIWKNNPNTDICFIYCVTASQLKFYQNGTATPGIKRMEQIADHYQIPSVHMGLRPAKLVSEGKLIRKGDPDKEEKKVFSKDGTHPLRYGGDLYAESINRAMQMMVTSFDQFEGKPHVLSAPLIKNNWDKAKMLDPHEAAQFSNAWKKIVPSNHKFFKTQPFAQWFPYMLRAENPGDSFTIKFKGNMIGFFDLGGPEVGQLEVSLNGKPVQLKFERGGRYSVSDHGENVLNRFNKYCNNRYRAQYVVIETEEGTHTVTFTISKDKADKKDILKDNPVHIDRNPGKFDRTAIYIGKILLNGELVNF
ncbi:SGNH/GDSL hydrolase family protein [Sphingobacterium sp. SGG-5]|uniref:SGNH/GDSL hydrolase family protein n=1 Tax=Sphingobacterium sp. SGG-5 TaxID=2710881 RepID=UPI0013ECBBDB|nr:SGNH/GDSL hydrolase family protein [Sphingobacterium sp. SGG-5]NGM61487.1 SGNH/GDSL hydrolase family protein [Sphingobacterium sp. SGG-5]